MTYMYTGACMSVIAWMWKSEHNFIIYLRVCVCVCVCVYVCACVRMRTCIPWRVCGGQSTMVRLEDQAQVLL